MNPFLISLAKAVLLAVITTAAEIAAAQLKSSD